MTTPIFHEPWWLQAVAPEGWQEVRVDTGGSSLRLPFVIRRVGPVRVVTAPPLTNRLGPLIEHSSPRLSRQISAAQKLVEAAVDQLPTHQLFRQDLRHDADWLAWKRLGFAVEPRISYVVEPPADLDAGWSAIDDKVRSLVRRATPLVTVRHDDIRALVRMATATFDRQDASLPYSPALLGAAARAALDNDRATVVSAHLRTNGEPVAAALFVHDADRTYYLVGGADPEHRDLGASSVVIWEGMRTAFERGAAFDFEGSMIPSIERHFRGYGGRRETYMQIIGGHRAVRAAFSVRGMWRSARRP